MAETILAIQLYAELLLNIKSLTLSGTVRSKATAATKAVLTTDGSVIRVEHEGNEATIRVPAKTIGKATATLDVPADCTEPISARVQLDGDLSDLVTLRDDNSGNIVPWSAPSMTPDTSICCRSCTQTLVKAGSLQQWKDLPSENWAEMMDFWHCHKPDPPHGAANGAADEKGYASSNKVIACSGTGMVDNGTFLLAPSDCLATAVDSVNPNNVTNLQCPACHTICGAADEQAAGWRLFKWRASIRAPPGSQPHSFPVEKWLSSHILTTSETRGVRKFLLKSPSPDLDPTLLWLFTPDLYFCSSNSGQQSISNAARGLKILRQSVPAADAAKCETATSVEELELPDSLNSELLKVLQTNTELLPDRMRKYQDWTMSVMRRFSPEDLEKSSSNGPTDAWTEEFTARPAPG